MNNYQPTHGSHPSHQGEKNTMAQPTGAPYPAQGFQGVMGGSTAHTLPGQIPVAGEAEVAAGNRCASMRFNGHGRINFNPTHTCATCNEKARSNHALEVHAREQNHQAFLCLCGMQFKRLFTLDRHIADQAGSKHHCNYCDDNKGFAREDKLIDHLRSGHKFGEKAIAQFRSQARSQSGVNINRPASIAATTAGPAPPVSTSTSNAAPEASTAGWQNLQENFVGPSPAPFGFYHDGVADHSLLNVADLQPFSTGGSGYRFPGSPTGLAGSNAFGGGFAGDYSAGFSGSVPGSSGAEYSGIDFADFNLDLDMSGMDNGI